MNKLIIDEFNILIEYFKNKMNTLEYSEKDKYLFKINAISNGINIIKSFHYDLSKKENIDKLDNIKGIGKGIIRRINEINKYGYLPEIKNFKEKNNQKSELYSIYGLGYQNIYRLNQLGITTIKELKEAIKNNKYKPTRSLTLGLKYYSKFKEHIPREEMDLHNELLTDIIKRIDKNIIFKICGSYRRGNDYSNDIDCIFTGKNNKNYLDDIIQKLIDIGYITDEITESRTNKSMAFCLSIDIKTKKVNNKIIRRIDFLYVPYSEYYTSLFYFTGDKYFNQYIRKVAKNKGFKISEHGIYYDNKKITGIKSEKDIFKIIGESYVKPNDRQYRRYIKNKK